MQYRITNLNLPPGYGPEQLLRAVTKKLTCAASQVHGLTTIRRSVDARGRSPRVIVDVLLDCDGRLPKGLPDVERASEAAPWKATVITGHGGPRPVVAGAGPAGLVAALTLAEAGLKPILVERGQSAPHRAQQVTAFWQDGTLDTESNVLYGEGGAGLFSDGKLTSRSKARPLMRRFFDILVSCGASPDILIDAEPHIGSDVLESLVPEVRRRIVEFGGDVRFGARLDGLAIEGGALRGVVISGEELRTDCCILATGHSARDVYEMLARHGVPLEAKSFAIGVRIELPQDRIDAAQWGGSFPNLGKASFRLTRREEEGLRACYTFCMCPGGLVIGCASSAGLMTTNGMSLSQRNKPFGNAAFLVPVTPEDFPRVGTGPIAIAPSSQPALAGLEFQRVIESAVFAAGGGAYGLPAQRLVDFLEGTASSTLPEERSCTRAYPAQLRGMLPECVESTLRHAVPRMLQSMRGVQPEEILVYGAETRSSSPVRVVRDEDGQSAGVRGLYPCGEGAGYAGGIVSSGIDGLRAADAVTRNQGRS